MNRRHILGVLSSVVYISLILTQFQNCAPPQAAELSSAEETDSEVRIVDRWATQKIQLLETAIVIRDTAEFVNLGGLCQLASDDAELFWEVKEYSTNVVMEVGESFCNSGTFKFEIDHTDNFNCDQDYELVVSTRKNDFKDNLVIRRKCDPKSSLFIEVREDGAECYVEHIAQRSEDQCFHVCYQGERIFSQDRIDNSECSVQVNAQLSN